MDNNREAEVLAESQLLEQIRNVYEDVETTAAFKRREREKLTKEFIETCMKTLSLSQDEIRSTVNEVIKRAKWIEEIEELDETGWDGEEL